MTMDIGTFVEVDGQVFYIHENGGPGSGRHPTGATAIEIGPKKSNRIKMYRQGKKIAKEIQMRKTYYEMDIGSMVDVDGEMYYTRNNGGDGSGNFGHAGRPGEVGGSASGGSGGGSSGSKYSASNIKVKTDFYSGVKYAKVSGTKYEIREGRGNKGKDGYRGYHIVRIEKNGTPVYVKDADDMDEVKNYLASKHKSS